MSLRISSTRHAVVRAPSLVSGGDARLAAVEPTRAADVENGFDLPLLAANNLPKAQQPVWGIVMVTHIPRFIGVTSVEPGVRTPENLHQGEDVEIHGFFDTTLP